MYKKNFVGKIKISNSVSYFGDLLTILVAIDSYTLTTELVHNKRSPIIEISNAERLNDVVEIPYEGITIKKILSFKPISVITSISNNTPVESIELNEYSLPAAEEVSAAAFHWVDQQYDFNQRIISAGFINYFEGIKDGIHAKYSADSTTWPMELNFARVIRNAFAHGGKINFTNPAAPTVTWQGLSYGPNNNGHVIFHDIFMVEIIVLFQVIDSCL